MRITVPGSHNADILYLFFSEGAKCSAWGDPHYTTFDGEKYDFQGLCKYRMVEPCKDFGSMPDFNVVTKNRPIKRPNVSITKYLDIKVYGFDIQLEHKRVYVSIYIV